MAHVTLIERPTRCIPRLAARYSRRRFGRAVEAFLLHDVFDYPYDEIAAIVDRSEAACRQLVSRARHRVDAPRRRFDADRAHGRELTRRFLMACGTGIWTSSSLCWPTT